MDNPRQLSFRPPARVYIKPPLVSSPPRLLVSSCCVCISSPVLCIFRMWQPPPYRACQWHRWPVGLCGRTTAAAAMGLRSDARELD
eukprot:364391-Chlamydomonas_euryale.AAC.6